ncbi:LacI family DNA-binding transcriptional regulator [Amycolatopsis sp.]|uniref:LacI family DNA-binding transcriptional regulator n=1 Tax=Amycolatopsis sp. TaxID=37632 RepID=UPI002D804B1D|nr:LacI family DNA-binding transcriptional regulator [Amycolatopsis sp.]HET6708048.1 LacI family DNA-binding transcriptional regulator [Amycolatopsis sp.]
MSSSSTEPRRVTIHDVARSAGVSRQTVSRALNDKAEIDGSTKQRVLDAARALGYRPSRFARGLVRPDTTTIGLVVPDLLNPFFTEVASGALEAARARGWHVVVHDTADDPEQELATLRVIGTQVDAVAGYFGRSDDDLERLTAGIPVVLIGSEPRSSRFPGIGIDGEDGVREAVAHLVSRGHRRIGMLDGHSTPSVRRRWFLRAAAECGVAVQPGWVAVGAQSVDGGGAALAALLAAHPDVTAVFAFNDVMAIGALREARRFGLRLPADLAVIGFDGLALGTLVEPELSSVAIDTRAVGALAVEQAARLVTGAPPLEPAELIVRARLHLRESA